MTPFVGVRQVVLMPDLRRAPHFEPFPRRGVPNRLTSLDPSIGLRVRP
jgi:hypothetical protein